MEKHPIRVVIVDDEPLGRQGVRLQLATDPGFEIISECSNGREALSAIRSLRPELVFLDIQMPGTSGLELLTQLPSDELPLVVFVTAYDAYALKAFEVHALDYLLKPIDPVRFAETVARIKQQVQQRRTGEVTSRLLAALDSLRADAAGVNRHGPYLSRFTIKDAEKIYFVPVDEVDWIESADYYVKLHTGAKAHLLRETLARLERQLDPEQFVRIHRSASVRVDRIREIRRPSDSEPMVILKDGTEIKLGPSYRDRLDSLFHSRSK